MTLPSFTDLMAGVRAARAQQACRICGCTEERACWHEDFGPCWWVTEDLCSHCGIPAIVASDYDAFDLAHAGADRFELLAAWAKRARAALGHAATTPASAFEP